MSETHEISVYVTVTTADDIQQEYSPPSTDDRLRCDLWAMCDNPYCFEHGCINALRRHDKGAKQ